MRRSRTRRTAAALTPPAANGFALLTVLWLLVGLSALAIAASLAGRQAVAAAQNRGDLARAAWRAEGCAERARVVVDAALSARSLDQAGRSVAWRTLDRLVAASPLLQAEGCDIGLSAAGSALDVNAATGEQLHALFRALGVTVATADSLEDAILDWRDADDLVRAYGAERSWYEAAGRFPPRNGPLGDGRELRSIRGLEEMPMLETVLGVEPGRVCLYHAPPPVLAALPGIGEEAVLRILERRESSDRSPDLAAVAERLSPRARESLLARYAESIQMTTSEPEAWILTGRARIGSPPVTAVIELRLVRAGDRAAIVRRRTWTE